MTRILLLVLLFMSTVLSYSFDLKQCGDGKEFACFVRDECKGDLRKDNAMREMKDGAKNYVAECDVHVLFKRYNISSYFIRLITKATEIKLVQEKHFFGCQVMNEKIIAINSDSIKIDLVSSRDEGEGVKKEIMCEIVVTYKDPKEAFSEKTNPDISVVYNPKNPEGWTVKIENHLIPKMITLFESASHQCDPGSIHFDDSKFEKDNYHIQPIQPHIEEVRCADKYALAFMANDGAIQEAQSIKCDKDTNGKWQYYANKIAAPSPLRAVCRRKLCGMCQNPNVKCEGSKCKIPKFEDKNGDNCHTYKCENADQNNGESIVTVVIGGKKEIGKFVCEDKNDSHAWTFNGKSFITATCHDEIDCAEFAPVNCPKTKECPTLKDASSQQLACPDGYHLEVDDSSADSSYKPKTVQCDKKKGTYYFKEEGGETIIINEKMEVTCAKKEEMAAAKGGMEPWMWISIGGAIVFAILLLVFVLLCIRRKRKEEEEKKSLLKKNDSQPSSATESGNLQGRPRVLVQPSSTAKQISSEQQSENTAKDKTKKVEKAPTREPTIELHTAYSKDKSKRSDEGPGSAETDMLNEGRRSTTLIQEESAPSAKASQVESQASKKEKKDDRKPRKFELNDKEKKIAKGVWRKNDDYPTMADIESDWDDEKDGKVSKRRKRTVTRDIPTADTPSARGAKGVELNEKTAEMERLLDEPAIPFKLERVSEEKAPAGNAGTDSYASSRKNNKKFATILTTLDATQEQKN